MTAAVRATEERVEAYLALCRELIDRVDGTEKELVKNYASEIDEESLAHGSLRFYRKYAEKFIDQIDRRLLKEEKISHSEKVFSIFEEHIRWRAKGKASKPVELGLPVCLVEDQYQFILHHKVMFTGQDVKVAVPMIQETQALFPDLRACSFDRRFHSPENRKHLDEMLEVCALPRKGRLSKADIERETREEFIAARRQHPAVESAINALDHRGLDRVRTHGRMGFARTVALSVLGSSAHRLGSLLQQEHKSHRKRLQRAA